MSRDPFYCKHCNRTWQIQVPIGFTGDAFVHCPECEWTHPRQFTAGVAVGCEPPTTKPRHIYASEGPTP